jgi:hypothetical protein
MTMPPRLTLVGDLERRDHYYLPADATCFFWGDYTPHELTGGLKWGYSPTNQLIANFKKKMDRAGHADWRYKAQAISTIATAFAGFWKWRELLVTQRVCLIPLPPSRDRADPLYDPRMLDMLRELSAVAAVPLDVRDCLSFSGRHGASHESEERRSPDDLYSDLTFDSSTGRPEDPPDLIFLFDDMLTTGAHFVAATRRLTDVFPEVQILGNFVSRRVLPNPFDDFDVVDDA